MEGRIIFSVYKIIWKRRVVIEALKKLYKFNRKKMLHLNDKSAVVTGGISGIGYAIVNNFLQNGMKVYV